MLLKDKTAVVFGAGGAIGSQVAEIFSREGATLFLSGIHIDRINSIASRLKNKTDHKNNVYVDEIDALNEKSINIYFENIINQPDKMDIVFNATGIQPIDGHYGKPATELSYDKFLLPLMAHTGTQFLTARAAAKHMIPQGSGVILTLSASVGQRPTPFMAGIASACAAIEGMTRSLAAEFGPKGIRVICLRPSAMPETRTIRQTYTANAQTMGITKEKLTAIIQESTLLKHSVTLTETAEIAAFLVSDRATALTGQTVDVSCGEIHGVG
ncbi:SDR family oxidoreductase [soil metagenome]